MTAVARLTSAVSASLLLLLFLLLLVERAGALPAQDPLDPVRQLYADAQYERALTTLERLKADPAATSSIEIDRYRVLCLMALGRTKEADAAIEAILTVNPLYRPGASDTSPAVRAAFAAVRKRMLPAIARAAYSDGREAFDRHNYVDAAAKFEQALNLVRDPVGDANTADLRLLADGFLQLARAALGKPISGGSGIITDPVPVRQEMPQWTFALASSFYEPSLRAVVEVEIDGLGDVVSADVIQSSHPQYNSVLAKAALAWKYEPARRDGQPTKTRLRVDVVLKPK
jgi:tetratricopeptide (TPR) repeat protein